MSIVSMYVTFHDTHTFLPTDFRLCFLIKGWFSCTFFFPLYNIVYTFADWVIVLIFILFWSVHLLSGVPYKNCCITSRFLILLLWRSNKEQGCVALACTVQAGWWCICGWTFSGKHVVSGQLVCSVDWKLSSQIKESWVLFGDIPMKLRKRETSFKGWTVDLGKTFLVFPPPNNQLFVWFVMFYYYILNIPFERA